MMLRTYLIGGYVAVAGLVACQGTSGDALARSQELADRHNFHQAYWVVAQALDASPEDETLERVFWQRRLAYLLDKGQQLVFQEQEQKAIEEFQKALAIDPGNHSATVWIARARLKLATAALYQAEGQRHEGNLDGALRLYNKALSYAPEMEAAVEGIKRVNDLYQNRSDKAGEHYTLGSRARGEQRFRQSFYHSGVAKNLDEANQRAGRLHALSGKRLADELFAKAKAMEDKGYYAAAWQDYRQVSLALPGTPGLEERIAAMKNEVDVRDLCREAGMLTRRGKFDEADAKLAEAFQKTKLERAQVSGLMLDSKNQRYKRAYTLAKDMEFEYQFETALEAFKAIDKAFSQRVFLDVKARISSLTSSIAEASKAFKAGQVAEKAGNLKEALERYEEAVLVYPGYQGLGQHIKELRARL